MLGELMKKLGVGRDVLGCDTVDALIHSHLLCRVQLNYDPDGFHRVVQEDSGWGDPRDVMEIVGVEMGQWGRGRGGKMDLGLSFGVYEVTPLETRLAKGAFGRPVTEPRLIQPRRAPELRHRIARLVVVDSDGDHVLQQNVSVTVTEEQKGKFIEDQVDQWALERGWVMMDVCGTFGNWISIIFTAENGGQFHAAWSGAAVPKAWWNAFAWTTRGLSHHGIEYIFGTGMDDVTCCPAER